MKHLKSQRGIAPVLEILLVLAVLGALAFVGYRTYQARQNKAVETSEKAKTEEVKPLDNYYDVLTEPKELQSPDGTYVLSEKETPGGSSTYSLSKNGALIASSLPTAKHKKDMGLGTKIAGQYGISFRGWHSNVLFVWWIQTGAGDEYEYLVDASTGEPITASYRHVASPN